MKRYRVTTGLDYPVKGGKSQRAEPGQVVDDLPAKSVPWLLKQGHIEEVTDGDGVRALEAEPGPGQ